MLSKPERLPISECVIGLDGSPNVASSLLFIVDTEGLVESNPPSLFPATIPENLPFLESERRTCSM